MKKLRILAGILSVVMVFSAMTTAVFAAGFDDVENDSTVSWAKTYINQMTDAGYIKGYEDGTFKPFRAISKVECLLLMSRMLGFEEDDYSDIALDAISAYSSVVSKYNTTYTNELCYLMYLGILDENDLVSYASAANANTELLRHQAAVLMCKMLGQSEEAAAFAPADEYGDAAVIPSVSAPYVGYVTEEGIMNGMDKNEEGKVMFSPLTSLTRAQMATLLARTLNRLGKFTYQGTVVEINLSENYIVMAQGSQANTSKRVINGDTIVRVNGALTSANNLNEGDAGEVIEVNGHIQLINVTGAGEVEETDKGTVVYAKIFQAAVSASGKKITLVDTEDSTNTASYYTTEDCTFSIKGSKAVFTDLKKNDFVKVIIDEGEIVSVEVCDRIIKINGTLNEVDFDEEEHVYLTVTDEDNDTQTYVVSNNGATVKRDGENAEYRELAKGDKVEIELTAGKITGIKATSLLEKFSGVLSEIVIAKTPSVTILIDGKEKNYTVHSNAKITISGIASTFYDLRPNSSVTGTLDGNVIRSIAVSSIATNEEGEFTAEVVSVNTSYKVIKVIDENGDEQQVYYGSKTNFLKKSGKAAYAKDLKKGDILDITGSENNGVFEATIVIVK